MKKRRIAAIATMVVGAIFIAAPAAMATGQGEGHTPVVVCHNVVHNPHIIVVDDDSTKLKAHLAHRTQDQLLDLVEGVDGTAEQIRAACVKHVQVTEPPVTVTETVPGLTVTDTVTGPTVTVTETNHPTVTETATGPAVTVTEDVPGPTTTVTSTGPAVTKTEHVAGPTTTETVTGPPTKVLKDVPGPVSTVQVTQAASDSKTVVRDGKETLAYTGMDIGAAALGFVLFAAGFFMLVMRQRIGKHT